ncbi:MAG: cytochrome c biogenesis protein CcsA, partial [Deltaproteobacteria bacterium]|nr:cytochrome c biogenesis protein CcsA [Deltaproteobacteria bacterium]
INFWMGCHWCFPYTPNKISSYGPWGPCGAFGYSGRDNRIHPAKATSRVGAVFSRPMANGSCRNTCLGKRRLCHCLVLGNAAFAIACLVGILYLIQERTIKDKKQGFFFRRLPSLKLLDSTGYASLIVGFPLLTFGIISGIVYAQMVRGQFWSWDPREIFAVITWLVYAALLHERLAVGWRGKRAAIMTIVGFLVLLFTFFLFFLG